MKKLVAFLFSFVLVISAISVCAEGGQPETIQFRGIPWLSDYATVKPQLDGIEGISKSWYKGVEEMARIEGWYRQWSNMYADDNVTDGGVMLRYTDATVAGYKASLTASFIYPIEGKIAYNTNKALFYKGEYKITDLEDIEGAYNDMVSKFTSLYGAPEDKSYYNSMYKVDSPKGSVWTAKDGSIVWAGIYYNSFNKRYDELWIVYSAPGTTEMLNALSDQIKQEAADAEAAERENNSSNFDGL